MADVRLHTVVAGVVLALSLCGQAVALTVYDIIQLSSKNYRDDDILALIQATDSAFELRAGDITRLMELGVSERVIQAMLKAVPDETAATPTKTAPPGAPGTTTPTVSSAAGHVPADTATTLTGFGETLAGGRIAYEPFSESGVGRHHHSVVTLAGLHLLVLRDEGLFPSVAARADAVLKRLGRAASADSGIFRADHSPGGDSVMFYEKNTQTPMIILKVTRSDAAAYQRRSGRAVTPALLAAYWSDLLSDYWSIAASSTSPLRLADIHEGEALNALHEQWGKSSQSGAAQLADAARLLSHQTQQHLLDLATTVPHGFMARESHQQEQP